AVGGGSRVAERPAWSTTAAPHGNAAQPSIDGHEGGAAVPAELAVRGELHPTEGADFADTPLSTSPLGEHGGGYERLTVARTGGDPGIVPLLAYRTDPSLRSERRRGYEVHQPVSIRSAESRTRRVLFATRRTDTGQTLARLRLHLRLGQRSGGHRCPALRAFSGASHEPQTDEPRSQRECSDDRDDAGSPRS